ncbi:MAG: hypothetical protein ABIW34_14280 [Ginsengibacter sp.]
MNLEASNMNVLVTAKFIALSSEKTKFISEEIFTFQGIFIKLDGFLEQNSIKKAHQKQMNAFKKFAAHLS